MTRTFEFPREGTRFLLYPKPRIVAGFDKPRLVHVDARPGSIGPGPSGRRLYVVDAWNKRPYRDPDTGAYVWHPPYPRRMRAFDPVRPNAEGHFDSVAPRTREFSQAALYASVASVMAIWEHYLGRRLRWGVPGQRRLELIPRVKKLGDNAWSGDGYIECGFAGRDPAQPYAEDFDVVAHEVGHQFLKRVIGNAPTDRREFMRKSHDEAGADLVSLVAVLHFDYVVSRVLAETRGKLYSVNLVSEIGQYRRGRSPGRLYFHDKTLRAPAVRAARRNGDKHTYAQPFLGAAFDVLVEIFESHLVRRGLISAELARSSTHARARRDPAIHRKFATRYRVNPDGFAEALGAAAADFARLLALAWRKTRRTGATFSTVAANLVAADRRLHRGRNQQAIRRAFRRRRIVVRAPRP